MVFSMIFPFYCFFSLSLIFHILQDDYILYIYAKCMVEGHITNHQQGYDGENMGMHNARSSLSALIVCLQYHSRISWFLLDARETAKRNKTWLVVWNILYFSIYRE